MIVFNGLFYNFGWRFIEGINLKGSLYGLDVYQIQIGKIKTKKIAECLGLGVLFSQVVY